MKERIQKLIAHAGIASRRKAEELIGAGKVTVNGEVVTELGRQADLEIDDVRVEGRRLRRAQKIVVYALNKPVGVISSRSDERGRANVTQLVPTQPAVYPVGRLDRMSEGLLILTNDGELAYELTHPKFNHAKEYELFGVTKDAPETLVKRFAGGLDLPDGRITPDHVEFAGFREGKLIIRITVHEGRSHLLRRMASRLGFEITRLRRIRIGQLKLQDLPPGKFRRLKEEEIAQLRTS